jgi:hypothetical protein
MEADTLYRMGTAFPYVLLYDISDISYREGAPRYTARLARNSAAYHVLQPDSFTTQEAALRLFSLLRERLSPFRVSIVSESPPSPLSGAAAGALTLEVSGRDFTGVLETLDQTFTEQALGIQTMTISLDRLSGAFLFFCSFTPYRDTAPSLSGINDVIPAAFGYVEPKPPEVVVPRPPPPPPPPPLPEEPPATPVGFIKDEQNNTIVYYKNPEGKLSIQEEHSP